MIVSESSTEPPYPHLWEEQDTSSSSQDYLFQLAIRQITDLIACEGLTALDFTDVMVTICGGLIRFGVEIASGDGRAVKAAKKAKAGLKKQGVELQKMTRTLNSISGSANMAMDDYNSFNRFVHEQCNDESLLKVGVIVNNSLDGSVMAGIMAVYEPPEELVFTRWVKLYDKYERFRHCAP